MNPEERDLQRVASVLIAIALRLAEQSEEGGDDADGGLRQGLD